MKANLLCVKKKQLPIFFLQIKEKLISYNPELSGSSLYPPNLAALTILLNPKAWISLQMPSMVKLMFPARSQKPQLCLPLIIAFLLKVLYLFNFLSISFNHFNFYLFNYLSISLNHFNLYIPWLYFYQFIYLSVYIYTSIYLA